MKSVANLASNFNVRNFDTAPTQQVRISITKETAQVVNDLFIKLKALSPAWQAAFSMPELEASAKRDWIQTFAENGIYDSTQTELGIKKRRAWSQPWFPSVAQFVSWCKPTLEDYGLMSAEKALRAVVNNRKKSHPVIFIAAEATGSWALKTMTYQTLLPIFTRNYEIACNRFMAGEDLSNVIPKALPCPSQVSVVTPPIQVAKNAAKLRKILASRI